MAYFVAGDRMPTVEELRQGADAIDGAETVVFAQDGSFWVRVDSPLIGEQFGFLSDVSVVDFGGNGIIHNVTQLNGTHLYQVVSNGSGVSLSIQHAERAKRTVLIYLKWGVFLDSRSC